MVGAETMTRLLDWQDRATAVLFGDGAGATVVSGAVEGHIIKNEILSADPAGKRRAAAAGGVADRCAAVAAAQAERFGSDPMPTLRLPGDSPDISTEPRFFGALSERIEH